MTFFNFENGSYFRHEIHNLLFVNKNRLELFLVQNTYDIENSNCCIDIDG